MEKRGIVVVGAGPAGSSAAEEIAKAGHDALLLEKNNSPGETSVCGGALTTNYVQLGRLPHGLVQKHVSDWLIHMPRKVYHVKNMDAISFDRASFDRFLAEVAVQRGAELRLGNIVTDIKRSERGLTVHVKDRMSNREYEVNTKLVIFADGPCTMAQEYGLGFPRGRPDIAVQAAIYELEWRENPLNCFEAFFDERIAPWGYAWVYPKRDILNVGVGCLISKMKRGNVTEYLNYFVEKNKLVSHHLRSLKRIRFAADIIPLPHETQIVGNNMMVVGDAAGMVDPIWGGGIGPAMRAASIAGQVAAEALENNRFDAGFLSRYENRWERSPDYKHLRRSYLAHRLFLKYSTIDKAAYSKFITVALWVGRVRKLTLSPEELRTRGAIGVSNFSRDGTRFGLQPNHLTPQDDHLTSGRQ